MTALSLSLPDDLVREIADRAASLVVEQQSDSKWLTRDRAARYLGVPIARLEKDKAVPCHRWDGRVFYNRDELDGWLLAKGR